jgi:two-component system chemotaxis response regulator CheY
MKKCLVVDDSRVIRKVARKILEELNFEIDEAEDGATALAACRATMPDAILLDGHMPNMSGVEFLRALRRETGGNKPVVVFCVIENDVGEITEAVGAGANEYLLKPFDRDVVKEKFADAGLFA